MKRKQLLFATYDDDKLDEGFSYAVDLAKTLEKDLSILLVTEKKARERFDDFMAAAAFAEESADRSASEILNSEFKKLEGGEDARLARFAKMCGMAGVALEAHASSMKLVSAINEFIKHNPVVDMVLLGPTVTAAGKVSSRELKKLVSSVSRPVVTMARQNGVA